MSVPNVLLAYLSPETVVPVASIVAACVGGAMFLTRGALRFLAGCFPGVLRRRQRVAEASEPHFRSPARDARRRHAEVSGPSAG